ncbi:hypothetical protein AB0M87_11790 [Streptomyces sp. NPDC051320]|uniref:hypothetical protein n=1 Tax=Streptomyces sp. NPDC051320 TaxID=3154644 RepID=UPI003415EE87
MTKNAAPEERPDEGSPAVSHEELAEFLQQAEDGTGREAAPKEPSARARMVTARLREQDAAVAAQRGGRFRRRAAKKQDNEQPWQPEGWRTGPAWQEMNGRGRKRRRFGAAVGIVAAVGLALAAMRPGLLMDHLPGRDSPAEAGAGAGIGVGAAAPLAPETARPHPLLRWTRWPDCPPSRSRFWVPPHGAGRTGRRRRHRASHGQGGGRHEQDGRAALADRDEEAADSDEPRTRHAQG